MIFFFFAGSVDGRKKKSVVQGSIAVCPLSTMDSGLPGEMPATFKNSLRLRTTDVSNSIPSAPDDRPFLMVSPRYFRGMGVKGGAASSKMRWKKE